MGKKSKRGTQKASEHTHVHHHQGEGSHHHHKLHEGAWYKAHHKTKSKQHADSSEKEGNADNVPSLVSEENTNGNEQKPLRKTLTVDDYKRLSEEKRKRLRDLKRLKEKREAQDDEASTHTNHSEDWSEMSLSDEVYEEVQQDLQRQQHKRKVNLSASDNQKMKSGPCGLLVRFGLWIALLLALFLSFLLLGICRIDSTKQMLSATDVCSRAQSWVKELQQEVVRFPLSIPVSTEKDDENAESNLDPLYSLDQQEQKVDDESVIKNQEGDYSKQKPNDEEVSTNKSSDDKEESSDHEEKGNAPKMLEQRANDTQNDTDKDQEDISTAQQPVKDSQQGSSSPDSPSRHYLPRRFRHFRKMAEMQSAAAAEHHLHE